MTKTTIDYLTLLRRYALARRRAAQRWARMAAAHPTSPGYADRARQARDVADAAMARVFDCED